MCAHLPTWVSTFMSVYTVQCVQYVWGCGPGWKEDSGLKDAGTKYKAWRKARCTAVDWR